MTTSFVTFMGLLKLDSVSGVFEKMKMPTITCSILTIETLEQGVKNVQS